MVAEGLTPDPETYGAFIGGYSAGNMLEADKYFYYMLDNGLVPNNVFYTVLINRHFKAGNLMEAFSTFRTILGLQVLPDLQTYSAFIHGLSTNGKIQEAIETFIELKEKGFSPDVIYTVRFGSIRLHPYIYSYCLCNLLLPLAMFFDINVLIYSNYYHVFLNALNLMTNDVHQPHESFTVAN